MSKRPIFKKVVICLIMVLLVFQIGTGIIPVHAEYESKILTESKVESSIPDQIKAASSSYTFTTANQYWTSGTINGDLHIGPNSIVTINGNVTVTGNVYIYGALVSYGGLSVYGTLNAQSVIYGSSSSVYQGSANFRGGSNYISSTRVSNQAYEMPFVIYNDNLTNENETVIIKGKTLPFLSLTVQGQPVSIEADGTFTITVEDLNVGRIEFNLRDVFGYNTKKYIEVKDVVSPATVSGFNVSKVSHDEIQVTWEPNVEKDLSSYALYLNNDLVEYVSADSTFYTFTNLKEGTEHEVSILAIDSSNNASDVSTLKATSSLSAPSVNPVSPESTSITGQAFPGTKISVLKDEALLASGSTDLNGKFSIAISPQQIGTILSVAASNSAGVVSAKTIITVEDKTAPAKPQLYAVTDKDVIVKGTAEVDSKIIIKAGEQVIGEGFTDADGNFLISISKQKAGTKIAVTATDASGNISEVNILTVLDVTAPVTPEVDKVTDSSLSVTGVAEEGAKVTVKAGATSVFTGTAARDGKFSVSIAKQEAGTKISVTATDLAGNVSAVKEVIVVDGTAPEIALLSKVTHHSTRVIGTAEAESIIVVKAGTKSIGTATTNAKGKYEVNIPKQIVGTKLTIVATDAAGNNSEPLVIPVVDGNYPDLKLTHWALDPIMYLADAQIIGGYPNGEFQPEKNTTRAEAAKMLAIALDLPIPSVSSGYKDVSSKHWAKDYIAAVSKAGLFNGNPDGTFAPDKTLKRAEMAKIISIAYEFKASENNYFKDVKTGYWAKGYISGLYENGITTGYSDKTFRAEESTTRAEFSVFLARAMNMEFR